MQNYDESLIRNHYHKLTMELIRRHITITTMESITSGQIASLITDTEGASSIFAGSVVTYSNQEKIHFGVPSDIIEKYSVYSKETAEAMAKAAGNLFSADVSIGITGTAGNADPNNISSIPGEVYFAIKYKVDVSSYFVRIPPQCSRLLTKLACAEEAYEKLVEILQ